LLAEAREAPNLLTDTYTYNQSILHSNHWETYERILAAEKLVALGEGRREGTIDTVR
jgi:hypothetical protein